MVKKLLKQSLLSVDEYIIDFLDEEYIDYLDLIDLKNYEDYYYKIYNSILLNDKFNIFEYVHKRCMLNNTKLHDMIIKTLNKMSENMLNYLILNNINDLRIILVNLNSKLLLSLLSSQSLSFIMMLFNIIDHDSIELLVKNVNFDMNKYHDIRIIKWLQNIMEPYNFSTNYYNLINYFKSDKIIRRINYTNITLNKLLDILSVFDIDHEKYQYLLSNDNYTFMDICRNANAEVVNWILHDYTQSFNWNIHLTICSACYNNNNKVIKIVYDYFTLNDNLSKFNLNLTLKYILKNLKNLNHTKQLHEFIMYIIELGGVPKTNSFYKEYYKYITL